MITAWDEEYKATKRIKQGLANLTAPFDELARWISSTWHVTVLNVIYHGKTSLHGPGLQVILEHQSDAMKFYRGVNFDPEKQIAIKERFLAIIGGEDVYIYDVSGLSVGFSAFAPLAREEAHDQIKDDEVNALKSRIGNPALWEISRNFGQVTFFFYTNLQAMWHQIAGKKAVYSKMYFELLKPHDEFGYIDEKEFSVAFDTKHNFDKKYKSNWFYYYR